MRNLIAAAAFFFLAASASKTVYVTLADTNILSAPSAASGAVAKTKPGDPLSVLGEEEKFYKVKTRKGVEGYVQKLAVSDKEPAPEQARDNEMDQLLGALGGGQRAARMEDPSASHSIRGLKRPDAEKGGVTAEDAARAVAEMDSFEVGSDELENFQREGGVGKYAR